MGRKAIPRSLPSRSSRKNRRPHVCQCKADPKGPWAFPAWNERKGLRKCHMLDIHEVFLISTSCQEIHIWQVNTTPNYPDYPYQPLALQNRTEILSYYSLLSSKVFDIWKDLMLSLLFFLHFVVSWPSWHHPLPAASATPWRWEPPCRGRRPWLEVRWLWKARCKGFGKWANLQEEPGEILTNVTKSRKTLQIWHWLCCRVTLIQASANGDGVELTWQVVKWKLLLLKLESTLCNFVLQTTGDILPADGIILRLRVLESEKFREIPTFVVITLVFVYPNKSHTFLVL